jgi:hypothetical protein
MWSVALTILLAGLLNVQQQQDTIVRTTQYMVTKIVDPQLYTGWHAAGCK